MTAPVISAIHPGDEDIGILRADTIRVTFDQEIDPITIGIIVEGLDVDDWSSEPDHERLDLLSAEHADALGSTSTGLISGTVEYFRVDNSGTVISGSDYSGNTSWKTQIVFTPEVPFEPGRTYRVYIPGQESSELVTGASSRTVFDTQKGANIEDGEVLFIGGYTGVVTDRFHVKLLAAGNVSDKLLFQWWKDTSPLVLHELTTKENSQLLDNDVYVRFSGDFAVDDSFIVIVKPGVRMVDTYTWTFTTDIGDIKEIPDSVVQTPSIPIDGFNHASLTTAPTYLTVLKTVPENRETNLTMSTLTKIVITFSEAIDDDTIIDDNILIWCEPVNGIYDTNPIPYIATPLTRTYTIVGSVLTITIDPTELRQNNLVSVKLFSPVAGISGLTLEDDYEFYFTTEYHPLYFTVRRMRLNLGRLLDEVPNDTINLAISEASREAQELIFTQHILPSQNAFLNFTMTQYTRYAAELILINAMSDYVEHNKTITRSKQLADLKISHSGRTMQQFQKLREQAENNKEKWERVLNSAGEIGPGTSLHPVIAVKGQNDPDRPELGRLWADTWFFGPNAYPASNINVSTPGKRRHKKGYMPNRWGLIPNQWGGKPAQWSWGMGSSFSLSKGGW